MQDKSKKLILIISLSLFLISGVLYYFFSNAKHGKDSNAPSWVTFRKTSPKKIDSYPTTEIEKEKAKISPSPIPEKDQQRERQPASVSPKKAIKKSLPGREWNLYPNQELPKKISFKNEPQKEWKELMGQDVMRFLRPETKLFVKKEKSLTLLQRDGGLHVEQVYIKMISPEGRQYSYQAFVNSESGKIIKTWNRTIHEPLGKETPKFRPTGIINPNGSQQF